MSLWAQGLGGLARRVQSRRATQRCRARQALLQEVERRAAIGQRMAGVHRTRRRTQRDQVAQLRIRGQAPVQRIECERGLDAAGGRCRISVQRQIATERRRHRTRRGHRGQRRQAFVTHGRTGQASGRAARHERRSGTRAGRRGAGHHAGRVADVRRRDRRGRRAHGRAVRHVGHGKGVSGRSGRAQVRQPRRQTGRQPARRGCAARQRREELVGQLRQGLHIRHPEAGGVTCTHGTC